MITWKKSSYSSGNGNCVEVFFGKYVVAVRDSRGAAGPTLVFRVADWMTFVNDLTAGG